MRSCICSILPLPGALIQWIMVAVALTTATSSFAQLVPKVTAQSRKEQSSSFTDISMGVFGQLTLARMPANTFSNQFGTYTFQNTQGTSASAGVLGTFHQSFRPWVGYNINLGYSRFNEDYSEGAGLIPNPSAVRQPFSYDTFLRASLGVNMYEVTVAYVVQGPRTARFDTFAQFGAGGMAFLPTRAPYGVMIRPAMIFGTGCDYALSDHWALRGEYRGLFYRNPGFRGAVDSVPTTQMYTITNEPTISLVYRFEGKK